MKTYKCNRCNNFNSKQFNDISRHLCKNEPCKISLEGYSVKKDELIKRSLIPYIDNKQIIDSNRLKKKCNYSLTKTNFFNLFKTISNNKLRNCPLCDKSFNKKYELKEHIILDCVDIICDEEINDNINNKNTITDTITNNINNITNITANVVNNNNMITNNFYIKNTITDFNDKWDTSHITTCQKYALILSMFSYTTTLQKILQNKNNMNVIIDKESNSGLVYTNNNVELLGLDDILEESFIKLYDHLTSFITELNDMKNYGEDNTDYKIDKNFFNEIKNKLRREFELHTKYKPDIKNNEDKTEIFNKMKDIYTEIKSESIKILQQLKAS